DEALAACDAPVWQGHVPLILRGRHAWVEARAGRVSEGVARMREVLRESPDYWWGWEQLATWCRDGQDHAGYLEAAEALARLAPQDPVSFGYLGEARQRTGDAAGAREALRRATEIAPGYAFAALALFNMDLTGGDLEGAAATLAALRPHADG